MRLPKMMCGKSIAPVTVDDDTLFPSSSSSADKRCSFWKATSPLATLATATGLFVKHPLHEEAKSCYSKVLLALLGLSITLSLLMRQALVALVHGRYTDAVVKVPGITSISLVLLLYFISWGKGQRLKDLMDLWDTLDISSMAHHQQQMMSKSKALLSKSRKLALFLFLMNAGQFFGLTALVIKDPMNKVLVSSDPMLKDTVVWYYLALGSHMVSLVYSVIFGFCVDAFTVLWAYHTSQALGDLSLHLSTGLASQAHEQSCPDQVERVLRMRHGADVEDGTPVLNHQRENVSLDRVWGQFETLAELTHGFNEVFGVVIFSSYTWGFFMILAFLYVPFNTEGQSDEIFLLTSVFQSLTTSILSATVRTLFIDQFYVKVQSKGLAPSVTLSFYVSRMNEGLMQVHEGDDDEKMKLLMFTMSQRNSLCVSAADYFIITRSTVYQLLSLLSTCIIPFLDPQRKK
ncbi:unnamed protein product [Notodromas monacha]|uniref:Gustatory receptor n=1 Tax=Notodromas monacha TaxID=399045 RepID=A0A7R9BEU4_9CRUS|nr:unnamed protein product [Notodromas monacha]CAG0912505.1 unnamed protein product [Notodromas monacha]